jgi:hypothetical protein
MMKPDSIVTGVLVALALVGALATSFSASAATATAAQSGDAFYYKHTGGVPPQ